MNDLGGEESTEKFNLSDPDYLRVVINACANRIDPHLQEILKPDAKTSDEIRHSDCRIVNGMVVVQLINQYKLAAIIYTIDSNEVSMFTDPHWSFHSIGIAQLRNGQFLAFDQTSKQSDEDNRYFFEIGTLQELGQKLAMRFGEKLDWNLEYEPMKHSENTVQAKLAKAQSIISNNKEISYNENIKWSEQGIGIIAPNSLGITHSFGGRNVPPVVLGHP